TYTLTGATTGSGSTLNGVSFNKGTTHVLWKATDGSGNFSPCGFDVIVEDHEAPVITCPAAATTSPVRNTNAGVCTWTSPNTNLNPTATDNCSGTITFTYTLTGVTTGTGSSLLNV